MIERTDIPPGLYGIGSRFKALVGPKRDLHDFILVDTAVYDEEVVALAVDLDDAVSYSIYGDSRLTIYAEEIEDSLFHIRLKIINQGPKPCEL